MKPILIVDIETTGFQNQGGKIVEIGAVSLDLSTGNRKIVFDKVCHEDGITRDEVENSWIIQNSSLTVEDIRYSPNLRDILGEFQELVDFYKMGCTAYNNKFDFGFLESRGVNFHKKLPCPMLLATDILKIPSRWKKSEYKWPNFQECHDFFWPGSGYIEQHRGAHDSLHEAKLVHRLYELGIFTI